MPFPRYAIGCDYGTESVRVVVVDVADGTVAAAATAAYPHGVIDRALPSGQPLPPDYALQHPADWLDALAEACLQGDRQSAGVEARSRWSAWESPSPAARCCPVLVRRHAALPGPTRSPPCRLAWPKLWKHHGAHEQADRLTRAAAAQRREPWLARYGGTIGVEWFFPKVLETLQNAPGGLRGRPSVVGSEGIGSCGS